MRPFAPRSRRALVVGVLVASAFAGGLVVGSLGVVREARAQLFTSSIQVPPGGLTFRSPDGRAVARLSYDARGGVFEVLDDKGGAISAMGRSVHAGPVAPLAPPATAWSVDDIHDPWAHDGVSSARPQSGL